jgi:hypothetical protein
MPSPPSAKYQQAANKAKILRDTATDSRLGSLPEYQTQVYYHSALAAYVAGWEVYVENLIREFFNVTADPLNFKFNSIHSIARDVAEESVGKFNTPNSDNSRNLLAKFTGYDPISDWIWTRRGMSALATRQRLNEILQVRHSFAHGFPIPAMSWNQTSTGKVRLTAKNIDDVQVFFNFLVSVTDSGMKQHIQTNYGVVLTW